MGNPTGFKTIARQHVPYRDVAERLLDYDEIYTAPPNDLLTSQGARCMDCGVPFCQSNSGCPVDNLIPEWNDLVYRGRWREALDRLHRTNNFPEFTGRVCPAPCEGACVLGLNDKPVTIKNIENAIIDRGWEEGWVSPQPPAQETGFSVGIVGSGPAGLAAAQQLRRAGHAVSVYERAPRLGGLLTYGIPIMKLGKDVVERRIAQMRAEGVEFHTNVHVGGSGENALDPATLRSRHDVLLLATGSTRPRDVSVPGRTLGGIHFAMEFLTANTEAILTHQTAPISAKDKHVVVIGGGDTGTDCIATSLRHGCASLVNFELMPQPPLSRAENNPWPQWPRILRSDYGHEEAKHVFGQDPRTYTVMTTQFLGENGRVTGVETVQIALEGGRTVPIPGTERVWPADLVLISAGFVGSETSVSTVLGVELASNGTYRADASRFETSVPGIYATGDCRRGQSLVVWAIREGRDAAQAIHQALTHRQAKAA